MKWDFSKIDDLRRRKMMLERRDIHWQEVADRAGVSLPTLFRYRQNRADKPFLHVVEALADYFEVPLEYFRADWPDVNPEEDTPKYSGAAPYFEPPRIVMPGD